MYPYKNVLSLKKLCYLSLYRNIFDNNKTKKVGESKVVCSKEMTPKLIQIHRNKSKVFPG